jgi:hypothetical protein
MLLVTDVLKQTLLVTGVLKIELLSRNMVDSVHQVAI